MAPVNFQEQLNHAARLLRQGQWDGAANACGAILRAEPRFFPAYHLLAIIAFQRGDLNEAIAELDRCLLLKPDYAEALNDRGVALFSLDRYVEALASYDKALASQPTYVEALNNRGTVLNLLGRDAEALEALDKALALQPNYVDALNNRGLTLHKLRRYEDALQSHDQALAIKKDSFQAHLNRGPALTALDRHAEALASYDRALELRPDEPDALLQRGKVLVQLNRVDEATACYRQLLATRPDHAEARTALCMAQVPTLYMTEPEVRQRRDRYRSELAALAQYVDGSSQPRTLADAFGRVQPFYLAYQGENDRDLQALYGSLFCRVMAQQFPPPALPEPPSPDEPVRIGIVSAFFREHTIWKLMTKGWISQIDRQRFRIFGYHTSSRTDLATHAAADLCDRFVQGPLSIEHWRQAIAADAPHVLIYPEVGMDRVPAQLAAQRLAPVQCNSWGHPSTSGFPTLDYFLTSDLMEPPDAQDHYTERLVRLPNLSIYYEPMETPPTSVARADLGFRPEATVYWCAQALFKYLPQRDQVFARIAHDAIDCQFVFIENFGAKRITELFQQRLDAAFGSFGLKAAEHCVFLPRLTVDRFVAAIGQCDVILDSIGWSGGNSTMESLAQGLPIVTMPGPLMRGRHTSAILTMMGVTDTIAETVDGYVAIAVRLAREPQWRETVRSRMRERRHRVYRDDACIAELERFLDRVARPG